MNIIRLFDILISAKKLLQILQGSGGDVIVFFLGINDDVMSCIVVMKELSPLLQMCNEVVSNFINFSFEFHVFRIEAQVISVVVITISQFHFLPFSTLSRKKETIE